MKMRQKKKNDQAASLLMFIIICALFLGVLMSSLFQNARASATDSSKVSEDKRARYAAYAGIQVAFARLEQATVSNKSLFSAPSPNGGTTNVPYKIKETQLAQSPDMAYTVEMSSLGPNQVRIFAQGLTLDKDGKTGKSKAISAYGANAYRPTSVFDEAGFGYSATTFASSTTERYTSPKPQGQGGSGGGNKNTNASIGSTGKVTLSSSTIEGDVILAKSDAKNVAKALGEAPPSLDEAECVKEDANVTISGKEVKDNNPRQRVTFISPYSGTTDTKVDDDNLASYMAKPSQPEEGSGYGGKNKGKGSGKDDPPTNPEPFEEVPTISPGIYESISISGQKSDGSEKDLKERTIKLTNGDYYITGDIDLKDGANLIIGRDAKVRIFIGGNLKVDSASINTPRKFKNSDSSKPDEEKVFTPDSLCMFFLDEKKDEKTGRAIPSKANINSSTLYATMAGKWLNADVANGTNLYGAINADELSVKDSYIHYDTNLKSANLSKYTSWRLSDISIEQPKAGSGSTSEDLK